MALESHPKLIIHWREPQRYDSLWAIRGLSPNGHYYGELTSGSLPMRDASTQKSGLSFSGHITADETAAVHAAAGAICSDPAATSDSQRLGLLAEGDYSQPRVIYQHFLDVADNESAKQFTTLISILRPYFYSHLDELVRLTLESNDQQQ